jgi:AraC-like DNA-binding protein
VPIPSTLPAPVVTVLEPHERQRVDDAGEGLYRTIHRETVADAIEELRKQQVSAVLLSVLRCGRDSERRVATVVREFPTVPTLALLGAESPGADVLLRIGNAGVTRLVDVRQPAGWSQLRRILAAEATRAADRTALARLRDELGPVPPDVWLFFEALFLTSDRVGTVRELASRLEVLPSTLMSRFFRARLPAPKRYLAYARLVRAARLLEDPGHSIADAANALEYSSPQSFSRHVRTLLQITATDFRREMTMARMLERFVAELITPHRAALARLQSLVPQRRLSAPPSARDRRPAMMRRVS